jgi:hypothetical protein
LALAWQAKEALATGEFGTDFRRKRREIGRPQDPPDRKIRPESDF